MKLYLGLILNLTLHQGATLRLELLDQMQPPRPPRFIQVNSRIAITKKLDEILHAGARVVSKPFNYLVCTRLQLGQPTTNFFRNVNIC